MRAGHRRIDRHLTLINERSAVDGRLVADVVVDIVRHGGAKIAVTRAFVYTRRIVAVDRDHGGYGVGRGRRH